MRAMYEVFYTERNERGELIDETSAMIFANSVDEAFEKFDAIKSETMEAHHAHRCIDK